MKAIRKSDGKLIEVEPAVYSMKSGIPYHKCESDGKHYPASDLDFDVEKYRNLSQNIENCDKSSDSDLRISVVKLREVLESIADGNGFLCEDVDVIIEKVKSEI